MALLPKVIYENQRSDSLVSFLRRKRFAFFKSLIQSAPDTLNILDIGGTLEFWVNSGFLADLLQIKEINITLLNIKEYQSNHPNIKTAIGDATNLKQFRDGEFDIVFSNSVIEHLFTYENQLLMSAEIKRISKRFFIHTPNKYFPIEPHFQFPLFQFLPLSIKVILIRNFKLGWRNKAATKEQAVKTVTEIRLLGKKNSINCFQIPKYTRRNFLA